MVTCSGKVSGRLGTPTSTDSEEVEELAVGVDILAGHCKNLDKEIKAEWTPAHSNKQNSTNWDMSVHCPGLWVQYIQ